MADPQQIAAALKFYESIKSLDPVGQQNSGERVMPAMAGIYSAIGSAKRNAADFVQNPIESLQQMVGYANDRARTFNQQGDAAAAEFQQTQSLKGPQQMQLAQQLAEGYNPAGMVNNSLINKYPKVALDIAESPKAAMILLPKEKTFEITKSDASNIFGQGAERVKYIDSQSKGTIEILVKPNGTASVLGLEVPEKFRGLGIGQSLQAKAMQDFAEMQGQVSSKAAATTAYRLGRRPPFQPNATLKDVYNLIDENSSVNLVSPKMQTRFQQEQ